MGNQDSGSIEFTFSPALFFEDLPNNKKSEHQEDGITGKETLDNSSTKPCWFQAAKAAVPFSEDVFWEVLNRWVLEAPSVIPPISKVDILQDESPLASSSDVNITSTTNASTANSCDERNKHHTDLLEHRKPFRTIRRQLIPKRQDCDPVMEEELFFWKHSSDSNVSAQETREQVGEEATSLATFAPVLVPKQPTAPTLSESGAEEETTSRSQTDVEIMEATLPFFYPKVRGFRYGYRSDREEAPEDLEDHDCGDSHDHGQDPQHAKDSAAGEATDGTSTAAQTKKKTVRNSKRTFAKRAGWITLDLYLAGDEGEFTKKMQYAFTELFKKLYKWGFNTTKGFIKSRVQHDVMVPKDRYMRTYARMKDRYAQKWVQDWPEKTDPRKFVFEDIAIAAWLVALWELEREDVIGKGSKGFGDESQEKEKAEKGVEKVTVAPRMQTFVDLGCGNGLLTHILNEEGHPGKGIDIVSRKVWEVYGPGTQLEAKTIIPNETTFENVDWIIGNHADELAPWVSIIASRSKPLTRFVVIPCCFFGLDGRYQFPKGAPDGKYKAYQDYICSVIETCGYHLQTEILRIPSTKNVALVGMTRKTPTKRSFDDMTKGGDDEEEDPTEMMDEYHEFTEKVDDLVCQSGLFVPRVSDNQRQKIQKVKQEARRAVANEASSPLPSNPTDE